MLKINGHFYILNGTKQWITNGGEADIYTIFAKTDHEKGARGVSAFIIEKGMDAIKRPFIVKRVVRAFESAKDSIEEQLMDKEAGLNTARENLVNAAKKEENLKQYIIHTELKLQQARLICEMLEKTAVLPNKENQN